MAIVASYFAGETYGLLGPQMAATVIEEHTPYECIVVAVDRGDDKDALKRALFDFFGSEKPVIGFSSLSGREDLFNLAAELKDEGAITLLAGPQADVDFLGEKGWEAHPHRFPGLSRHFSFAVHGPAEQILPYLRGVDTGLPLNHPGVAFLDGDGTIHVNPKAPWNEIHLNKVRWDNLHRISEGGLVSHRVKTAQVLQHVGCPYASRQHRVEIDYPAFLKGTRERSVNLVLRGCSFCDVAVDKGFHGPLGLATVLAQMEGLPEEEDGRKIPFELINENPLPGLPRLLKEAEQREVALTQINLTLRVDWLVQGEKHLREALRAARRMRVRLLLSSAGFESFDDTILKNLHKGVTLETNLQAIRLMRQIKREFPFQWAYSRQEGAVHGFIHPTPWDTPETAENIQRVLDKYHLSSDILPRHSIPLIIHHASGLAEWIRAIEEKETLRFKRYASVIGWWEEALLAPYIH